MRGNDDLISIASVFGVRVPDGGFTKSRLVCRFQEKLLYDYLENPKIVKISAPTVEKLSEMKIFYVLSELAQGRKPELKDNMLQWD